MKLTREDALKIIRELIKNENLVRHHLAAEVCMKAIWRHLSQKGVEMQGKYFHIGTVAAIKEVENKMR